MDKVDADLSKWNSKKKNQEMKERAYAFCIQMINYKK